MLIPYDSIWRTTTEWYRPVDKAPKADISDEMIGALKMWGTTGFFQIDFSFNFLDGTGGTPTTFPQPPEDEDDGSESDHVKVPVPAKGYIEGDVNYKTDDCAEGEDCHMLILSPGTKELFELYHVHQTAGKMTGALSLWKLDKTYPRSNRGQGCSSADAAGMPIAPGLIGYKETKAGAIKHALRFIIRNDYVRGNATATENDRDTPNNVYPGSHGSSRGQSPKGVPYGARFRLKAAVDEGIAKSPGAKALIKALKTYGMIMADGGNIPLVAESAKVSNDKDGSATWEGLLGPRDLGGLKPSDFEVVSIPRADPSKGDSGWFTTKAEYESQLKKPLGCDGIEQP